jgi:hypothetical protein
LTGGRPWQSEVFHTEWNGQIVCKSCYQALKAREPEIARIKHEETLAKNRPPPPIHVLPKSNLPVNAVAGEDENLPGAFSVPWLLYQGAAQNMVTHDVGHLLFTKKGVYFLRVGSIVLDTFVFGQLISYADYRHQVHSIVDKEKKANRNPDNLTPRQLIEEGLRILFIPFEDVAGIEGSPHELLIKRSDDKPVSFRIAFDINEKISDRLCEYNQETKRNSEIFNLEQNGLRNLGAGAFGEALRYFESAIMLNSQAIKGWSYKGLALWKMGRLEEALTCFKKTIELSPKDEGAWLNRAILEDTTNRYAEAAKSYREFFRLAPTVSEKVEKAKKRLQELTDKGL